MSSGAGSSLQAVPCLPQPWLPPFRRKQVLGSTAQAVLQEATSIHPASSALAPGRSGWPQWSVR